jgi:hypothetical protein
MKEETEKQNCENAEGMSFRPAINRASKKLESREPAHVRLYKMSKEKSEAATEAMDMSAASASFRP